MNEYKTTLDLVAQNLDSISSGLSKLSKFTNGNISSLKLKTMELSKDIEALRNQKCPKDPKAILEILEVARLKREADVAEKKPERTRNILLWIVAVTGGTISIILALEKWISNIS